MNSHKLATRCVHSNQATDNEYGSTVFPIFQTSSFAHDDPQELSDIFNGRQFGFSYSRIANPTVAHLENHVNHLENGRGAIAVSTGMAAMNIIVEALTQPGDHIISSNSIFGGTYYLLQEFLTNQGIDIDFVEGSDINAYKKSINEKTKGIFLEIIGNPKLDVPNIKDITALAKAHNIPVIVDCTSSTPYLFNAKEHGVDIVWYSATKWLGGGGRSLAGLIVDCGGDWVKTKSDSLKPFVSEFKQMGFLARCKKLRSNKGAVLSPFNAFLIEMGLETLPLRMEKQCENAAILADFFLTQDKVEKVDYPGLKTNPDHVIAKQQFSGKYGGLLTIRLGSKENCFKFIESLKLSKNLANLGDLKTIVIHPHSTIYRNLSDKEKDQAGAYKDLIRISAGIEDSADIINDFKQALAGI